MSRTALRLVALALALGGVATAHDSEPINTEFAAPFALHAGNIQLGFHYFRDGMNYEAVPITFEYGFAPRMQFAVEAPLTRLDMPGNTYIRPGNIGLAYRYLLAGANDRKFALSINPELGLPSGDKRVSERSWDAGLFLNLDTHLWDKLWTHTNLGYETPFAHFEEKTKAFVYRFAAMYEAHERVQPVLELIGDHEYVTGTSRTAIVPEVIFEASHRWELKAGVPFGLTHDSPHVGVQFQVTWKFGEGRR